MDDSLSIKSSLLDDEIIALRQKNDTKAIFIGLLSQLLWAIVGMQLKTFPRFFPEHFSNPSLAFWRSLSIILISYLFCLRNDIEITPISKIVNKFWFFFRNIGIFICLVLWVKMNQYLRLSTCQCISGCHPVIVLYLSVIILKEKFYIRYLIGILLCLFGTIFIVLNEKKTPQNQKETESIEGNNNIYIGMIYGIIHLLCFSASAFSQKFLCNEKMGGEVQNYYLGIFHSSIGLTIMIITNHYGISNPLYIVYGLSNGVLFYLANYYTAECLKMIPISKFMPITYMGTVYVFLLSVFVLREAIFFTDLFGSALIVSFQFYNVWVPLRDRTTKT